MRGFWYLYYYFFLWAFACVKECTHMWKSEESFQELVLLFYFEYLGFKLRYWELCGKILYQSPFWILNWSIWALSVSSSMNHFVLTLVYEDSRNIMTLIHSSSNWIFKGWWKQRHRIKNQTDNIAWYLIC